MAEHSLDIGVIVARKRLDSPWMDQVWLPHAVLPAAPAVAPGTRVGSAGAAELFYAGALTLTLHSSQTANYRDNLASGRPSLWVSLELVPGGDCVPARVTADPYEGEALTENIGGIVEALSMPREIAAVLATFAETFYVERPFFKRERDRADPDSLGRRRPKSGPRI
jgi:hypothetical protein